MSKARGPYRVDPLGYKKKALANVATNDTSQERVDETAKQRHWVELTDAEIKAIAKPHDDIEIPMTGRMWVFVADLMDKLKEKNNV